MRGERAFGPNSTASFGCRKYVEAVPRSNPPREERRKTRVLVGATMWFSPHSLTSLSGWDCHSGHVSRGVLFSGHLLWSEHFLPCCRRTVPRRRVESIWLTRAV